MALPDWSSSRSRFESIVAKLGAQTKNQVPNATWTSGHFSTDIFPFRAYARFSNLERSVDLSIDCKLSGDKLIISADVAEEEGLILADLPGTEIPLDLSQASIQARIDSETERITEFLDQQLAVICENLRS